MPARRLALTLAPVLASAIVLAAPAGAQASRPASAPLSPTAAAEDSALMAKEHAAWGLVKRKDAAAFTTLAGTNWVYAGPTGMGRPTPADLAKQFSSCDTRSYALTDMKVARMATDAVVTYKATLDQTCGKTTSPSPVNVMSVWQHRGNNWILVAHSEMPVAHS